MSDETPQHDWDAICRELAEAQGWTPHKGYESERWITPDGTMSAGVLPRPHESDADAARLLVWLMIQGYEVTSNLFKIAF